jgi:hypothetical protein
MRSIAASSVIEAPIEKVWAILSDIRRYPEWSPFVVDVGGEVKVGELVTLHVAMTPGRPPLLQKERVSKRDEGRELCWGMVMGHPILLKAERYQRLTALSATSTRYETCDDFEGLLVPVVFALYRAKIQAGFDATAAALKKRAESLP